MGVSYQQFRTSKLITHFNRAKADIANCCSLLEELSAYWFSAEAMARLGQKALHQIDTRLEHPARPEERPQNPGSVSAPVPGYNAGGVGAGSEDHRGFNDIPTTAAIQDDPALEPFEPLAGGAQEPGHDGFADIDMLFGDFLDLSLPTNFWDPVFTADEGTGEL
jgi:hypothetical protein